MYKCKECVHAIFDPLFGEYKCEVLKTTAPGPFGVVGCKDYKKGEPKVTAEKDKVPEED